MVPLRFVHGLYQVYLSFLPYLGDHGNAEDHHEAADEDGEDASARPQEP